MTASCTASRATRKSSACAATGMAAAPARCKACRVLRAPTGGACVRAPSASRARPAKVRDKFPIRGHRRHRCHRHVALVVIVFARRSCRLFAVDSGVVVGVVVLSVSVAMLPSEIESSAFYCGMRGCCFLSPSPGSTADASLASGSVERACRLLLTLPPPTAPSLSRGRLWLTAPRFRSNANPTAIRRCSRCVSLCAEN